jgi:catechol 2,3-dioxygenase-like lactoylglutathione lyase family enzyme
MNPQINSILLGVEDMSRAKKFYGDGLGCPIHQDYPGFVAFDLGDGTTSLGLYPWDDLAKDAGVPADGGGRGFHGFTLSYIVPAKERVDEVMGDAKQAGAKILKPAEKQQWGGYSGTFADPDGHVWKVASDAS